ncbi:MAG: 30S ribosomal protein S9 [Candidatus Absconditabacterales bacterium]|nr:30S ribosomal protein S9 [Candidatus Absconditabacterales bacterium]
MSNRYVYAVGRRKSTSVTIKLFPQGSGNFVIRHRDDETTVPLKNHFQGYHHLYLNAIAPLSILGDDALTRYDAEFVYHGGGISGLSDAIKLAFARALVNNDDQLKSTIKPQGFLTRDPRVKERKKFGYRKARKGQKRSKR